MKHIINNPNGRKPLAEDVRLGSPVRVRFTPKQMDRIKRKQSKSGKPLAVYIREASLNAVVRANPSREALKEIRALNNLGNNINALTVLALKEGFAKIADKASTAVDAILEILHNTRRGLRERKEDIAV